MSSLVLTTSHTGCRGSRRWAHQVSVTVKCPQLVAVLWETMGPLETWVQIEEVWVIGGRL